MADNTYLQIDLTKILRKWPPVIGTDRVCTKPCTISSQLPNEPLLNIEKEVMVSIPVLGLHRDPVYYPNPEIFDPERFNGENTIEEFAYIPFGCEILRKWPPAIGSDRACTKPYTIPSRLPDEPRLTIEKDVMISIPIIGLHRDPVYYPNPDTFDPERFNGENTIEEFAYIPFGCGPRKCIASRFALVELKALLFKFLLHFEILPGKKLQLPVELDKSSFNLLIKGGFWFILKKTTP
ncbi:hypothetical protein GWI33_005110 [Rhynchophorus ferrugineus]|uniref:Cytochrome P450 n=1 Tax=Rhynchophorus ferrugineus TaxID=354439 RepID=A0A834ML23_RHYFE|nr:hypothetical protein GWI33_005110 [Rhynchophorus ferrugineus]